MFDSFNYSTDGTILQSKYCVAIVGSGPRGLSVLERLAAKIIELEIQKDINIFLIDPIQVGSGRVWRTEQPDWYVMNIIASEVTAFSGKPDHLPTRPGSGPSLSQWWCDFDPINYTGSNSYAPRSVYGQYMQFVLDTIELSLQGRARLHRIKASVIDIEKNDDLFTLTLSDDSVFTANKVILVTGHALPNSAHKIKILSEFALAHNSIKYIQENSVSDMPLSEIPSSSTVGIIGLGLTFYDVMAGLTVGRGGQFQECRGGELKYIPSGNEPLLFAGSRSGMLMLGRGLNQRDNDFCYEPIIFTEERIKKMRETGSIKFREQVIPLLMAEVNLVYYETKIKNRYESTVSNEFRNHILSLGLESVEGIRLQAENFGIFETPPLDLDSISHPFYNQNFNDTSDFQSSLLSAVDEDLRQSAIGNIDSCLKAALEVIRDTRAIIRLSVDFSGLTADSHRDDFLNWYAPISSFLAAGAPRFRMNQARALIKSGILTVIGPDMKVVPDNENSSFVFSSPRVPNSSVSVRTLIDARIPSPNIMADDSPLTKNLIRRGYWTTFTNKNGLIQLKTGGVNVTNSPFHPINSDGNPDFGLYVLGIPTEHIRWFMYVVSSRPAFWSDFVIDADAIAQDILKSALIPANNVSETCLMM